jgi:DNA adenine methylase
VYCDPPYVPLSTTANFTHYTQTGFTLADQQHLAIIAGQLRDQGIPVMISNHDTPLTRELYADARIIQFDVRRVISCDVKKRGVARELLAIFE